MTSVVAKMQFLPPGATGGPIQTYDMRARTSNRTIPPTLTEVHVNDARATPDLGLHTSGFELVHSPSAVDDFFDHVEVMATYYEECRSLAAKLTDAHTTFTFDHVIREPGSQMSAGGTDRSQRRTGTKAGGGYIGSVHMDYTDNTQWHDYLKLHQQVVPPAKHCYALNFWRPLSASADDNPLAVCDARTVRREDLQETKVYGYGADNYSWHDIGIETFNVAASSEHKWFYYPSMTPDDVLIIKSYDSRGVIGTTCPHGSFVNPVQQGIPRKSIELRVLCFC